MATNLVWDDNPAEKTTPKVKSKGKVDENFEGIVGIDLGTTNCVVSYLKNSKDLPELVKNDFNKFITPSFIEILGDNKYLVGEEAKKHLETSTNKILYSFKPLIGTDKILYEVDGIRYNAQFCQSILLNHLATMTRKRLGLPDDVKIKAVITVPAYFDEDKKYETMLAAQKVGIEVIRMLEEPSASAFYTLSKKGAGTEGKMVIVYDLGGGTFDVSLVALYSDSASVVNIDGDSNLGGDDYDELIAQLIESKYPNLMDSMEETNKDLYENKLKHISEQIKIDISEQYKECKDLSIITSTYILDNGFKITITGEESSQCTQKLTDKALGIFKSVLEDYGLPLSEVDNIIMTGGSSQLPYVKESLKEFVVEEIKDKKKAEQLFDDIDNPAVNPDLSVGLGAGVYSQIILNGEEDRRITNIVTHNLGIEDNNGVMDVLIRKGSEIFRRQFALKNFIPDKDYAKELVVNVYEGDSMVAKENKLIRTVSIPIPEGTLKDDFMCEISFTLSKDKVLKVAIQTPDEVVREKIKVNTETELINPEYAYTEMVTTSKL